MSTRERIDRESLRDALNEELDAYRANAPQDVRDELAGCKFRDVELHARDETGCNWSAVRGFVFNGDATPDKEAARNRVAEAVRARYWLDEPTPGEDE